MTTLKTRTVSPIDKDFEPHPSEARPANSVESTPAAVADLLDAITGIELEAVLCGALMRLKFGPGLDPADILPALKALDPNVQVRDAFPMKGQFGNRETKTATALVITARVTDSGAFVDITCQNGDDISVSVSKKKAPEFPANLAALGRLTPDHLAKVQTAYDSKSTATVVLSDAERFGVKYWTTDDGKNFLDEMTPEPPAPTEPKA